MTFRFTDELVYIRVGGRIIERRDKRQENKKYPRSNKNLTPVLINVNDQWYDTSSPIQLERFRITCTTG